MERGLGLEWKALEPPRLIMPDGYYRTLLVDQYVPVLPSAFLPKDDAAEGDLSSSVAQASETAPPHPGGDVSIESDLSKGADENCLTTVSPRMFRKHRLG